MKPTTRMTNALSTLLVASALVFAKQAGAAQTPSGCSANNLSYNINNLNGLVNITNCTTVKFVSTVSQVNDPTTCNIILSTNGLRFYCPDATGSPGGSPTVLIPPNTVLAPGFSGTFTNQCMICVNPGVHTAQVELTDGGAVVQDNPLQDDPAAILKTLSINIFNPCIHVTKSCNGGPFEYGSPISFVGTVTNCGDVTLTNVTVFDDHAGVLISGLLLLPGQGTNFSATYAPASNLCGPFTNTVTATGVAPLSIPATVSSTASAVCTVFSSPCISVTKTCPGSIPYGTTSYQVAGVVTNCGDVPLVNVTVVDDNGTPGNPSDDVTILIGSIGVHGSVPYVATNNVPVGCGPFTDHVVASGAGACGGAVSSTNNCTTTVSSSPCIGVSKSCPGSIVYGTTSYQVAGVVTNCGNVPLTNVVVVDDNGTPGNPADDIIISLGTIAPGSTAPYVATNTVPVNCGPFTDHVVATGTGACGGVVNSTNSCTTTVSSLPCIGVTKTCPGSIAYGTTSYQVAGVVTNCGNVPLTNVVVVDDNGTPGNLSDDITILIGSIGIHSSAPYVATNTVPAGCGPFTDHVVASGNGACGGTVTSTNSCTTTVTTSPCIAVTKNCPGGTLPVGTTAFLVSGSVTNCGNVPLTNVVVVDDNGTTNLADDITVSIGTLNPGASAPWIATNTVPPGFCGPVTDHVTASGKDACSGSTVQAQAGCTTTILCPEPKICVTKGIICAPATGIAGCDGSLPYGPQAIGVAGTNQAAFCYQIIVSNCGLETLTNVQVTDSLLPSVAGTFPTLLLPGQSATNYYGQSYGLHNGGVSTNVNTVTAAGTGIASGITTNAQYSATAIVVPVSVNCSITLYSAFDMDNNTNDNHVTLPASATNNTPVEFTMTIHNTGQADLAVDLNGLPPLVDCGDDQTLIIVPATTNVPAGQSVEIDGCMLVSCPGVQINSSVQGTAQAGGSIMCVYDSQGHAIRTAVSSCSATVDCQQPVACRVTGGGTLEPGAVDTNCVPVYTTLYDAEQPAGLVLDHISHGGQLGAPYSQQDCGEILGNPCIRGEWEHVRHYQGTGNPQDTFDMNFHSANPKGVFDSLMCACLGCCGPTVDQPNGKFAGLAKKFALCNPDDHRVCGPMPRPAPANAIIFSGIGTFTPQGAKGNGAKSTARYVIFRVYIEDRSEPGGKHPKGANEPADVYCFQAWDTGIQVSKKPDYSTVCTAFRQALAADSCAFIQSISTPSQIVNGVVVGGVPPGTLPSSTVGGVAADIVDQGPLYSGNQQIHPSTGATCTVTQ